MDAVPELWERSCEARRQGVIETINKAFPRCPPPKEAFCDDDPFTYRRIEMHLLGKPWYELDLLQWFDKGGKSGPGCGENSLNSDSTYMLTPVGWSYYIPAYMIMCLTAISPDAALDDVLAHMSPKYSHHDFAEFVSLLTDEEVEACREFLSFVADCQVFGGNHEAANALSQWPAKTGSPDRS